MAVVKSNIKQLLKELKSLEKDLTEDIEITLFDNATQIELNAKRLAPVDLGKLRQSIYTKKNKDLNYSIVASEKYAPYQEFGTGKAVDLSYLVQAGYPKEYAMRFKGKGVKQINMPPQPFLFPALISGRVKLLKDLKELLNNATKKF